MKNTFLCLAILAFISSPAQNVGVGTDTPTEKLDVNGNVNINGNLKIANIAGQAGQVLMTNGAGNTEWADMAGYKNLTGFTETGAGSWTVPTGVSKIMVEIWGAGGGGNIHGGGGGGGYVRAYFDVTEGSVYSISVGTGGSGGGEYNGSNGTGSSITVGSVVVNALGGTGATYVTATTGASGDGGGNSATAGFRNFYAIQGEAGYLPKKSYTQYNATTFYSLQEGGRGGNGGNTINTGGKGIDFVGNTASFIIVESRTPGRASQPGGGGGSGYLFGGNFFLGRAGANGMVVIHY